MDAENENKSKMQSKKKKKTDKETDTHWAGAGQHLASLCGKTCEADLEFCTFFPLFFSQ